MKTTSYYPVIQVRDVQASARFYIDNLNFVALYDTDWYVHLQSKDDEMVNLLELIHQTLSPYYTFYSNEEGVMDEELFVNF